MDQCDYGRPGASGLLRPGNAGTDPRAICGNPVASVLVLGQAPATDAEKVLDGPDADDLRRRP